MAKKNREFSAEQLRYMAARVAFDAAFEASRAYDKEMDAEGERLGLSVPYAILPEGHAMHATAQALLDTENAARAEMYAAANALFDWATETTFKHCGTEKQNQEIRATVAEVKKMAWVQEHWKELVDLSMKLIAK